jgi:hypothetical protein
MITTLYPRHCEERSDETIQLWCNKKAGLLRFARNDDTNRSVTRIPAMTATTNDRI